MVNLDIHILEMKELGEVLTQYNFPNGTHSDEFEINVLKLREAVVDGYDVILHYSKNVYPNHKIETIQVIGRFSPFLPFCLICKIAKRFLGEECLSFMEMKIEEKNIYCWAVIRDEDGNVMENPRSEEFRTFEGLKFGLLHI